MLEYSTLLKEIEIAGYEHLNLIKRNPESYLKKAEELKEKVVSDNFLTNEDKEKMLKKISTYVDQVKGEKDLDINSFLLGIFLSQIAKEGILEEFFEIFKKFFK